MTKKEKQLLLQDLCYRLPYGVMIHVEHDWYEDEVPPYDALLTVECHSILNNFSENPLTCCFIIKPYLRPMSSMTEEEKNELKEYLDATEVDCNGFGYSEGGTLEDYISSTPYSVCVGVVDWLNEHHFDYRGLIEKGLALEAPEDMYN